MMYSNELFLGYMYPGRKGSLESLGELLHKHEMITITLEGHTQRHQDSKKLAMLTKSQ